MGEIKVGTLADKLPKVAVIQARMGSSRLPGKSMMNLNGQTLVEHVVHRSLTIEQLDQTILATSNLREDDVLAKLVEATFGSQVSVFRGDPTDVQDRFIAATRDYDEAFIARITADDPFRSPELFTRAFQLLEREGLDHVRVKPGTTPIGIDAEVFRLSALRNSRRRFPSSESAEHVTTELISRSRYRRAEFSGPDETLGSISLTIDTREDFDRCVIVSKKLSELRLDFSLSSTLRALRSLKWWGQRSEQRDAVS